MRQLGYAATSRARAWPSRSRRLAPRWPSRHGLTREQPREPGGETRGGFARSDSASTGSHSRTGGRLVVDDVVDRRGLRAPARARLRPRRRRGGSRTMIPPPSPTIGNCAFADGLDPAVVGGAIENAITEGDAAEVGRPPARDGPSRRRPGGSSSAGRGSRRIVLVLDPGRLRGRSGERGNALGDEAPTPASRAAASRLSVPSFAAHWSSRETLSMLRREFTSASAVASWTIASGSASRTAARTARTSSRSSLTGSSRQALQPPRARRGAVGAGHFVPSSRSAAKPAGCRWRRLASVRNSTVTVLSFVCSVGLATNGRGARDSYPAAARNAAQAISMREHATQTAVVGGSRVDEQPRDHAAAGFVP